jgi:hypothetical protein
MKKNGWAMSCGAQMIDIHRGRVVGDDWITLELNEYHEQKNMPGMTKLLRSVCGEHGDIWVEILAPILNRPPVKVLPPSFFGALIPP